MRIVEKNLTDIQPYEHNPRRNDDAVEAVAASIKEFGFKVPLVVGVDGVIVAGHTRYKAAQKLGLEKVPCIIADDLSDDQIRAFRLADNKVAELAQWDFPMLGEELAALSDLDMSVFGFDIDSIQEALNTDDTYTRKIVLPEYEATQEAPPAIAELFDTEKTDKLLAEIEAAEIKEDDKDFLRLAATRHTVFNYSKIAEYYSHASPAVQALMEDSALVIVDYDKAIMDGYVRLHDDLMAIIGENENEV